jgi:two-component system cell cycle sensor histidine kinase/response regulator CckA
MSTDLTPKETLLLVDDDDAVRSPTARLLKMYGYVVVDFADAAEALRYFADHTGTIDGVLTDVQMPGMNGPRLVGELRTVRPGVPVLFMSGYPRESLVDEGIDKHEGHFIQKPMLGSELSEAVRSILKASVPVAN